MYPVELLLIIKKFVDEFNRKEKMMKDASDWLTDNFIRYKESNLEWTTKNRIIKLKRFENEMGNIETSIISKRRDYNYVYNMEEYRDTYFVSASQLYCKNCFCLCYYKYISHDWNYNRFHKRIFINNIECFVKFLRKI